MQKAMGVFLTLVLGLMLCVPALSAGAEDAVVFTDPVLEAAIREQLGMPEGEITAADAERLEWLDACMPGDTPDSEKTHDISALARFVNLRGLKLDNNAIGDLSPLAGLTKLQELWVLDNPAGDLSPLSNLTGLTKLGANAWLGDVDFLGNMPHLQELRIDALRTLPAALPSLRELQVFCSLGGELTDISLLAQCPGLVVVDLSWNLVQDLTPLTNLPLSELYLQGNPIADYSPIAALYPNLTDRNFEYFELTPAENPDSAIAFPDPVLEAKLRTALGKPEGPITAGDAAAVTRLSLANEWQPNIPPEALVTDLRGLEHCINLQELYLDFNALHDLSPLAGLTKLQKLSAGGCGIGDIGPLAGLSGLAELSLFDNGIRELTPLAGLVRLRALHLANNPLNGIDALAGLTALDMLNLGACGLEDIGALAGLVNLHVLEIKDNYIADLTPLSGMRSLQKLRLANNPITEYAPVEGMYDALQDKDFVLGQAFDVQVPLHAAQPDAAVEIGDAALEAALREATGVTGRALTQGDLCKITKLVADGNATGDLIADLAPLSYCLNLEGLALYGSAVCDLGPIAALPRLRLLVINNAPLRDLTPLAGQQTLEYLELMWDQITDLTPLAGLASLQGLDLTHNRIADFSPLRALSGLTKLHIRYNATEDAGCLQGIFDGLQDRDFDPAQPLEREGQDGEPGNNGEPDGGRPFRQPDAPDSVIAFADPVLEQRVRAAMNRPDGPITAGDAAMVINLCISNEWQEAFAEGTQYESLAGLEHFLNLQSLDISWNRVRDLSPLAGLTGLTYLKAYGNQISDIAPLAELRELNNVNIGGNQVTDIGVLQGLDKLTELYLSDNPITDYTPVKGLYPQLTQKDFDLP